MAHGKDLVARDEENLWGPHVFTCLERNFVPVCGEIPPVLMQGIASILEVLEDYAHNYGSSSYGKCLFDYQTRTSNDTESD